jgi:lysine 2,3-aminomutase
VIRDNPGARRFHQAREGHEPTLDQLRWKDLAAIRLLDHLEHAGMQIPDPNRRGKLETIDPIRQLFLAARRGTGGASADFFEDLRHLFRQLQFEGSRPAPSRAQVFRWMERHPSGLDPRIAALRESNRERILGVIVDRISRGEVQSRRFHFEPGTSRETKLRLARQWWHRSDFHVRFAVRSPDMLNEMLDGSLDEETMKVLRDAESKGIPFFVNPYYLSLLLVDAPDFARQADRAVRDYVIYSRQLVEEFGHISAWEREDEVEPGRPNAAGWILPSRRSLHRRYPEVAILIPDSAGRACGGLCAACQRMYDFQSGHLNFEIDKLYADESWPHKMERLLGYFEHDAQLRDILITGGDALMSTDRTLQQILDGVARMAGRKREANRRRRPGEKHAELVRVRLGTRLPAYLPQRITPRLVEVLAAFRERAFELGVRQFVVQTHFESAMEVTPDAAQAIQRLQSAGWLVTNQLVFTAAASRRGHTARLRQVLSRLGVLPYYTFTVKGYRENEHLFAPNARSVQEQLEEKSLGRLSPQQIEELLEAAEDPAGLPAALGRRAGTPEMPFLATDRSVLNLPGVGKSMTFRTVGITRDGRRVLAFDHDASRWHSPVIEHQGQVLVIESKSIRSYLEQLEDMGEAVEDYETVYGYSLGATEARMPIYEYPDPGEGFTDLLSNFELDDEAKSA